MSSFNSGAGSQFQPQFSKSAFAMQQPNIIRNEDSEDFSEDKADGGAEGMHYQMQSTDTMRTQSSAYSSTKGGNAYMNTNPFTNTQN